MKRHSLLAVAVLLGIMVLPSVAAAQTIAYAVPGTTNVRAGPGTQFPIVARVRGGARIFVFGCLSDRAWCEIQVHDLRGWMSARRLEFLYGGDRVLVPEYYAYFGAPIISFDFGFGDDKRRHRRHRRGLDHGLTECLAPEGFCPGDRPGPGSGNEYRFIEPQSGGDAGSVSSGNAEVVITPGNDGPPSIRGDNEGRPRTECLAPDGFCP